MNKVLCLTLVLLFSVGIFAQEKAISESEFTTIFKNAQAKKDNKSYRAKTTYQMSVEGKPEEDKSGTMVMEFASPGMSRIVYQSDSKSQPRQGEQIKINDKTYTRENGAAWKQDASATDRQAENSDPAVESNIVYKSIGNESLNNQKAIIYEKTENRKRINKDKKEINSDIATKYWIGADGSLLKMERTSVLHVGDKVIHIHRVTNYEMDPTIKIEMPQVAGSEKQ